VRWLAWAVPAAATAALGLYEIDAPMLWRDELATWSAATRTIPQIWALAHHTDAVLSVYYAGLHLWMAVFGQSPTAMRLPSVLAMSGTAAVVALIARRFASSAPVSASSASEGGGSRAGAGSATAAALAAGLLYAVIPSVSRYAQEARPYAFASLFAALATLGLLRAVERPRWQRWAWYALTLAGAGASNLIALTVLAGHAVIVAAQWRRVARVPAGPGAPPAGRGVHAVRTLLAGFCGSAVVAVILLGPLIVEGHRQSYEQLGSQPTSSFTELIGVRGALWAQLFSSAHVADAVVLLAVLSVILAPRRAEVWTALASGVLPIMIVWAVSHGPDQYWTFSYMLFTVPAWAVSAGLGIHELWRLLRGPLGRPWFGYAIGAILVAVIGLAGRGAQREIRTLEAHNIWAYPLRPPNGVPIDYTAAVGVIAAGERPGDGIVYQVNDENRYEVDTAVAYYLRGKPTPRPVFQAESPARADSLAPVDTAGRAEALAGRPRIWVIFVNRLPEGTYTDPFTAIPQNEATALRAAGYTTHSLYQKPGITVALLTPR
jgi:mannosyltransferase